MRRYPSAPSISADTNATSSPRISAFPERVALADARFRLSVNLYGAPALTLKEFANYRQDLIIGGSLQMSVAAGML